MGLLLGTAACRAPDEVSVLAERQAGELAAAESTRYEIPLEADQYLEIEVDQRGIDVQAVLEDPAGRAVVETDNLLAAMGPERIVWLAPRGGAHTLVIHAPEHLDAPGRYEATIVTRRAATAEDRRRAAAAAAFYQAERHAVAGDAAGAVAQYREALRVWSELDDRFWQALVHYTLADVYSDENGGDPAMALEHARQALRWAEDSPQVRARARFQLAKIHLDLLFDPESARAHYEESLALRRELGDRRGEATTLHELGYVYKTLGELHRALSLYGEAIDLWRALADDFQEANTLHNRGKCNRVLGRPDQAMEDFQRALTVWEERDAPDKMILTLTGMAEVLTDAGSLDEAEATVKRALELAETRRHARARALIELGEIHTRQDDATAALAAFEEALTIFRDLGDRRGEASALTGLGRLHEARRPARALEHYAAASNLLTPLGIREIEPTILMGMARARRHLGDLENARAHAERALTIVESLRGVPASLDLRASYFATKQGYYRFYVDLLMESARRDPTASHEAAALAASERSRARSLLDTLTVAGIDVRRGADEELLERERSLERRIESQYFQRGHLLARGGDPQTIAALEGGLRDLLLELDEVRGSIRTHHPTYSALTQPKPLGLAEIQSRVLDDETLLLEYQLGHPKSYVWAVTSDSITSFELTGQAELEELARWAYQLLTVPRERQTRYAGRLQEALAALGEELIGPVAASLTKERLLIVADGALQYVPFAALPTPMADGEPSRPLVVDHEIVALPSASALAGLRRRDPGRHDGAERDGAKMVAVLADPVFGPDDPRVASNGRSDGEASDPGAAPESPVARSFRRLPYSRLEAQYILSQAASGDNFEALGFDATGQITVSGKLADYRYIHFATHSFVDGEIPELSSLVFSLVDARGAPRRDGYLRMHDVYRLRLDADLVTLSACSTAAGKRLAGEGLVGWTQGFTYAGARRVLVSLWSVDDEATAELMKAFYANMLGRNLPAAAALREAQISVRSRRDWRSPYYWAAFVLQGEYV